jgi:isopenicillin N synthase-like dioxygenase
VVIISWFKACLDSGFFYVINHGISEEFMDEVFSQSRRMFGLPLSEKMKILRNEKHRGYTPVLDELLDPENQVHGLFSFCYQVSLFFIKFSIFSTGFILILSIICCIIKVGDYKEGYYIGVEVDEADPGAEKPFFGPNVWPAPGNYRTLKTKFKLF